MSTRNLLVPHDFTPAGDSALEYAINFAKTFKAEVNLLHVTKDNKNNKKATARFEKMVADLKLSPSDPKVNFFVKKGDIFETIAGKGKELLSSIIVMGTHGATGMQKVFGSFAIKVITSTHIPFIIVQKGNKIYSTKEILFPINTTKESLQIEQVISSIAANVNAKVHVVCESYTDMTYKIKSAVHFDVVNKQFRPKNIEYINKSIPKMNAIEILKYSKQNNCDLIGISYYSEALLKQFDRLFQDLLMNNSKYPILIINSKDVGNYFF
jgi:nucleotide-binding universal stress UspA family protein